MFPRGTTATADLLDTEDSGGGLQYHSALEVVEDLFGMLAHVKQCGNLQQLSHHLQRCAHKGAELVCAAQVQGDLQRSLWRN